MTTRQHPTTVADLKAALAELPDWAAVQVVTYDENDCQDEGSPYLDYAAGVLVIDVQ